MRQDELLRIVQRHGHQARTARDEVLIKVCTECGNPRWNLELNAQKGVWKCWACKSSGTVEQWLKDRLSVDRRVPVNYEAGRDKRQKAADYGFEVTPGDVKSAIEVGSAKAYLAKRGLTARDVFRYNISVCVNEEHRLYGRLVFPVYEYWTRELIGHVARSYTNKSPKYLNAMPRIDVGGYRDEARDGIHVLVEGVFDAIRVNQARFQAGILLGMGGGSLDEWAAFVPKDERVVVLLDGEAKKRARQLTWQLGDIAKDVQMVELPERFDPADLDAEVVERLLTHHTGVAS